MGGHQDNRQHFHHICRYQIKPLSDHNKIFNGLYAVRDIIGALQVRCPYDDTECGWTGQVNEVASHGNACMYKTIECNVEGCISVKGRT